MRNSFRLINWALSGFGYDIEHIQEHDGKTYICFHDDHHQSDIKILIQSTSTIYVYANNPTLENMLSYVNISEEISSPNAYTLRFSYRTLVCKTPDDTIHWIITYEYAKGDPTEKFESSIEVYVKDDIENTNNNGRRVWSSSIYKICSNDIRDMPFYDD